MGRYNLGLANTIFELGFGTGAGSEKNAITVYDSGTAQFNYGAYDVNMVPYITGGALS
jgi:hypothetical protein